MERLLCRLVKNKEVTDLKISSKNCRDVNNNTTYNISVDCDKLTKNIVTIISAVTIAFIFVMVFGVIAYRLLTVSDSVIQSILEKWLETSFSGIEMLH